MEKNPTSVTERSSPHPSPGIIGETRIHRRLVKIPSDQRDLLDRQDSWAQFLNGRSKRFLNVPPDVLENLKKWHTRQRQPTQSDESISSSDPQADAADQIQQEGNKSNQDVQAEPDTDSDDNDDNAGTQFSWSLSPPQRKNSPQRASSEDAQEQFITQLPPISSPQPTVPPRAKDLPLPPFPPSSQDQEEPLDIEVPTAINDIVPAVNKSAVPRVPTFATPPSAQVVPCTFDASTQPSTQTKEKPKQRPYIPVPELYRPKRGNLAATYLNLGVAKSRNGSTPLPSIESSISTTDTSSSIIPSTVPSEAVIKALPAWRVNLPISPSQAPHTSRQAPNNRDSPEKQKHSPEYRPQSPRLRSSPPASPIPRAMPLVITHLHSASQTPFIHYCLTYPSYTGSASDFVYACTYIQLRQRMIRASLYDDFIRAWHEGYLQYVKNCDDSNPPVKALNAIEWYNDIDEEPVFTSRVITKQNLQSTLDHYPDELRFAQKYLKLSQEQSSKTTSTPDAARLVKAHGPVSTGDDIVVDVGLDRTAPEAPEPKTIKDVSDDDVQPAPIIALPQPEKRRSVPLHKSLSEIERRPAMSKGLSRSFSEATHHKRKASQELNSDLPKRLSVNSLPRSESGSNASVNLEAPKSTRQSSLAPSSTGEKRKRYADDPEKRSRAFAKFVKARKQWEKDSIASTAPRSTSPTSGQKQ
ncbi:hypothetical protein F5Y05DRAFT_392757 [Hypoxylon sp. FL0543]|nr:hypothetical protein F5Y05DRAFT_392757 [Hypoxylon sp. FL0543]